MGRLAFIGYAVAGLACFLSIYPVSTLVSHPGLKAVLAIFLVLAGIYPWRLAPRALRDQGPSTGSPPLGLGFTL